LLIVEYSAMASVFTDVVTALLLFLILPVTVASADRSFSTLLLIKNYLRSTMLGQDRLRHLALLSIEAESAEKLQTDQIIDDFASANTKN
jgi:hAT family C-terminal dimerisation region